MRTMLTVGVDYYPEQWDETLWPEDVRRMAALGVKVVRIGEFTWPRLEPEEGRFEFGWLDRIVAMIGAAGMKVILGTPTNCPPLWLYERHPETLQCERDGRRTWTGIRGHRCMTSPVFRQYAGRIVRLMAQRYADNPAVAAWQIDNEIESNHCTCPACTDHFRGYVQEKYHTLQALNQAWGTVVWGGELTDWSQVQTFTTSPNNRPDWYNPAYMLDYERFCSRSSADYVDFQARIIREVNPAAVVTTNACFGNNFQNFQEEFRNLDVAAYDNYPAAVIPEEPDDTDTAGCKKIEDKVGAVSTGKTQESFYSNAFVLDLVRSWKHQNFWILEQLGGPMGCWGPIRPSMEPGMLEGYALQAVAHGADLVSFFRWRTAVSGAEMFCYGLLDHDNRDNRYLREFAHFVKRLTHLQEEGLDGTTIRSQAAILYSADSEYAFRTQLQSEGFQYWTQLRLFHEACMNLGVNVDIVTEQVSQDDLDSYRVLMIPAYAVTDLSFAERVRTFVRKGGTAVITDRTGVKDIHGNCFPGQPLPVGFEELCGINIRETDAIGSAENSVRIMTRAGRAERTAAGAAAQRHKEEESFYEGKEYPVSIWCDLIETEGAQVIGRYTQKFYKGTPAITRNHYGAGEAWYIGTVGRKAMYRDLLLLIFQDQKVPMLSGLPGGVECTQRSKEECAFYFFFNNTMKEQHFALDGQPVTMQPLEVRIIRKVRSA